MVDDYGIKLIYIFGSYAKGENREYSDLDIAMYFDSEVEGFVKLDILDELAGIFNGEDIDLVTKVTFEARVMSEYMDMENFRKVRNEYNIVTRDFWKL